MFTLYGFDFSVPANKLRFLANHAGLDYEYKRLDPRVGDLKTEEHLQRHPAGKVPVIIDDGLVLFESNAILKYLAKKHGLDVYPKDAAGQAVVDQWVDFVSLHIAQALNRVFGNRVIFPMFDMEIDERSINDGLAFLERFLPVIDRQLQQHAYLAGEQISIADFCLLATLDPAEMAEVDLSPYASLQAYRERLMADSFYQSCFEKYSDCFAAMSD